jgi:benzoate membrane transport protein
MEKGPGTGRAMALEEIVRPLPRVGETLRNLRGLHLGNAVVSFLFACTGPVALILAIGFTGGLKPEEIASWIFVAFVLGGGITFVLSWLYRQPLAHAWTISGTAIIGTVAHRFGYDQIVGAYMATGVLMIALGLSGAFRRIMDWTPQPIVMAMVAAVFLKFGVLALQAFDRVAAVAIASTLAFVAVTLVPGIAKRVPPVLAALAAGAAVIALTGQFEPRGDGGEILARPVFIAPRFTEAAIIELVLPLVVSVLVLQNAQGIALLRQAKHSPPVNVITTVCGAGTIAFGLFGAVCACLTGPANAILMASGERRDHYIGALIWAVLAILFGVFAPAIVRLAQGVPEGFIYIIGGLAMLNVLRQSFVTAFGGKFALGALVTFIVTVTDLMPEVRVQIFGIGAPFWGLVFGIIVSLALERGDFAKRDEAESVTVAVAAAPPAPPARLALVAPAPGPFARKIQIALTEKGLACRRLEAVPDSVLQAAPASGLAPLPALIVGETILVTDQRAILEYLDQAVPHPRLLPPSINLAIAARRWETLVDGAVTALDGAGRAAGPKPGAPRAAAPVAPAPGTPVPGVPAPVAWAPDAWAPGAPAPDKPAPGETPPELAAPPELPAPPEFPAPPADLLSGLAGPPAMPAPAMPPPDASPALAAVPQTVTAALAAVARELGHREFVVGDQLGRVDLALVVLLDELDRRWPDYAWRDKHPALGHYLARLKTRPAVAGALGPESP